MDSYRTGYIDGESSRDTEIANLKVVSDHNLATYHRAAELLRAEVAELNKTILTMRDAAWELSKERDQLREQVKLLQSGILAVNALINDSSGVVGLHRNGNIAEWSSLRTGGQFESWLIEFDEALATTEPKS